jgi:hypothetical protein
MEVSPQEQVNSTPTVSRRIGWNNFLAVLVRRANK